MGNAANIHPTIPLDLDVPRKNESERHWAIKAALIHRFRTHPVLGGSVKSEKKTGELIADIRCKFNKTTADIPKKCVVEVQTSASQKDVTRATATHLKHGYAVYWVYDINALNQRDNHEKTLSDQVSPPPALGVAALTDGQLTLGNPITWTDFEFQPPLLGRTELSVPTYDRAKSCYDHGDFLMNGERIAIYQIAGESEYFISNIDDTGQRTLPERAPWTKYELYEGIKEGTITRESPVRGPP